MSDRTRTDVLTLQAIVANASPSAWRDGLVVSRHQGHLTVALLDGQVVTLGTLAAPEVGEPVAVHPVAGLVALGEVRFSVRILDETPR
ncbi:hypothetical protein [Cellulomonas sp. URHE0023]|uniref:hypothetical protein n=1 Tax=Cellulomonas sp. URHE0023 TaxID=1380354 RepID=UPI000554543C|nr:hypothetical protein [Cellulomonas sp. URHE0023]